MQKQEYSIDVLKALEAAKASGSLTKWGAAPVPERVNVFQGELKRVGVKNTGAIATPTVRNERAFLITVVGVTSVLATLAGQLPGDWVRDGLGDCTLHIGASSRITTLLRAIPSLLDDD